MSLPPRVPKYPGQTQVNALLRPVVEPIAKRYAGHAVQRLVGFWVLWHTFGGRRPLLDSGVLPVSSVDRQRQEFRRVMGVAVEDWQPDVAVLLSGRAIVREVEMVSA